MTRLNPVCMARLAALAAIVILMVQGRWEVSTSVRAAEESQEKVDAVANDTRDEDRAAIRSAMQSFVKAFEARDARALAAHWTPEGEYQNELGETVRGREALEEGFAEFFAQTPELKAEVSPESLRFLSSSSAIEEGSVTVRRGPTEPTSQAYYSALLVREDGNWLLAQLSEMSGEELSIEVLEWLIGDWASSGGDGDGAEIRTTYSWAPNKKFIVGQFTIKEEELTLSGSQVIGVDPAVGAIHTWTFEADGGIGEADWSRDGDHWVLDVIGTLPDGSTLIETNILRRVNDDTFTWQSIDRLLNDVELTDLAPVKVTRVKAEN
jgi:uncharacterized protein (TIGR02246 family)